MSKATRQKGLQAERDFCKWLFDNTTISMPERELAQSRDGGCDVIVGKFYFEVKRQETLNLYSYWLQIKRATKHDEELIPIVAYRQNHKQWQFLISAKYIGLEKGFVHLQSDVFLRWMAHNFD